jgi:putative oxidoreductase
MGGQRLSGYYDEPTGSNPIYRFFATVNSWNPTILRLVLGGFFVFHGGQKAFGLFGGPGWEASIKMYAVDWGFPIYLAAAAIAAEILGAAGLILGFFTRLAAFTLLGLMVAAIVFVQWRKGIVGMEKEVILAGATLALLFSGGGNLSLDKELARQLLP